MLLWITCSGALWRDLPKRFGSWKTVYSRFCKWRDEGILHKVFEHLPMRTLVFTQQQLELIKAVQIQKRGRKFRSKSAYWHKFRWKNNQNPCSCRR